MPTGIARATEVVSVSLAHHLKRLERKAHDERRDCRTSVAQTQGPRLFPGQEELAEQLGVSRQAVSKWERSESSPDTDNLIALARLYGVSIDELLYANGTGAGHSPDSSTPDQVGESCGSSAESSDADPSESSDADPSVPKGGGAQGFDVMGDSGEKVHIGPDGVHVVDGDDYVHVSWRDGVHVKSDKDGEVHVGWNGIHVTDPKTTDEATSEGNATPGGSDDDSDFRAAPDDFVINGEHFDNWKEVKKSCKQHGHHDRAWERFPYPILVVLVFLLVGLFWNAWNPGWVIFLTIPLYYTLGAAISKRRITPLLLGLYPTVCVGWFLYMAFILNQAHPAWLIFLTIPLAEWFITSVSHWLVRRQKQG